jgi:hypothetical protein
VVTVCDYLRFLIGVQLKHEIGGKALGIAFDRLIERFGRHPVEFGTRKKGTLPFIQKG